MQTLDLDNAGGRLFKYWRSTENTNDTNEDTTTDKPEDKNDVCSMHATCNDPNRLIKEDYECTCTSGFFGNGKNCTDYDECGLMTYECAEDEICKNVPGSYSCEKCATGYVKATGIIRVDQF